MVKSEESRGASDGLGARLDFLRRGVCLNFYEFELGSSFLFIENSYFN